MSLYGKQKFLMQKEMMKIMNNMIAQNLNWILVILVKKINYMKEKYLIEIPYQWVKKLYLVYVFYQPFKKLRRLFNKQSLMILDEVDSSLDEKSFEIYMEILKTLSIDSQIFYTSFKPQVLNYNNPLIFQVEMQEGSIVKIVDKDFAEDLLKKLSSPTIDN